MSDIFISYANEDRPLAELIAHALEEQGWFVWWDRKVPPGKAFDEIISEALDASKCVVVLWSRFSISSDWVKEEAAEGARRKILVPALVEDVPIPLGFRRIQAAQLTNWQKEPNDPEFQQLIQSVDQILSRDDEPSPLSRVDKVTQQKAIDNGGKRPSGRIHSGKLRLLFLLVGTVMALFVIAIVARLTVLLIDSIFVRNELLPYIGVALIFIIGVQLIILMWRRLK